MKCDCGGAFVKVTARTEEGIEYEAFRCEKCGEELLDAEQAASLAKALERVYSTTISKWGEALAIRIPSEIARSLRLKSKQKAKIVWEKNFIRVIPS